MRRIKRLRKIWKQPAAGERDKKAAAKRVMIWIAALVAGMRMLLFRVEISRYRADVTALLIAGTVLAVFGTAELYAIKLTHFPAKSTYRDGIYFSRMERQTGKMFDYN